MRQRVLEQRDGQLVVPGLRGLPRGVLHTLQPLGRSAGRELVAGQPRPRHRASGRQNLDRAAVQLPSDRAGQKLIHGRGLHRHAERVLTEPEFVKHRFGKSGRQGCTAVLYRQGGDRGQLVLRRGLVEYGRRPHQVPV